MPRDLVGIKLDIDTIKTALQGDPICCIVIHTTIESVRI